MYYIEAAERNLKKIFEIAKEKEDIELAKTAALIATALNLAKFEDQGFICGECGMAISEEMNEQLKTPLEHATPLNDGLMVVFTKP